MLVLYRIYNVYSDLSALMDDFLHELNSNNFEHYFHITVFDRINTLKQFIKLYKNAKDKEAFITMWEETLSVPYDKPYTIEDAYKEAYGMALAQL